uniref:MATH domain-containing protein n=1 Tax=Rhabditophanes sp. KR3021 TaxID=114890 RepID=A0AC35UIE6_9BILA
MYARTPTEFQYLGCNGYFRKQSLHSNHEKYRTKVKWDFLFDGEEKAMHNVFIAGNEMIALEKTYASEDHVLSIECILIDYCRDNVTNSGSGKPTYDLVRNLIPEKKDR